MRGSCVVQPLAVQAGVSCSPEALPALSTLTLGAVRAQQTLSRTQSSTPAQSSYMPAQPALYVPGILAAATVPRALTHTLASSSGSSGFAASFFTASLPESKKFNQRKVVGWTPEQFLNVISRVDDYKSFVPWCQSSRVLKREHNYLEAELVVGFQMLTERYTSKVHLSPGQVRSTVSDSYLFHHLDSIWRVEPGPTPKSSWLTFSVDFAFRSHLHSYLADMFFSEVVKQMTAAFEGRCMQQYGPSSLMHCVAKPQVVSKAT